MPSLKRSSLLGLPKDRRSTFSHSNGRRTCAEDPYGDNLPPAGSSSFSQSSASMLDSGLATATSNTTPEPERPVSMLRNSVSRFSYIPPLNPPSPPAGEEVTCERKGKDVVRRSVHVVIEDATDGDDSGPSVVPKHVVRRKAPHSQLLAEAIQHETMLRTNAQRLEAAPEPLAFGIIPQWCFDDEPLLPTAQQQQHQYGNEQQQNVEPRQDEVRASARQYGSPLKRVQANTRRDRLWGLENKIKAQESKCRKYVSHGWQKVKGIFNSNETKAGVLPPNAGQDNVEMREMSRLRRQSLPARPLTPDPRVEISQRRLSVDAKRDTGSKSEHTSRFIEHEAISLLHWTPEDLDQPITVATPEIPAVSGENGETPENSEARSESKAEDENSDPPPFARHQKPPMTGLWFAGRI